MVNKIIIVIACLGVSLTSLCDGNKIEHRNRVMFKGEEKTDIVIVLQSAYDEIMESLHNMKHHGRTETISFIRDKLVDHANQIQAPIRTFLEERKVSFRTTWMSNRIFARGVNHRVTEALVNKFPEIVGIRSPLMFQLNQLGEDPSSDSANYTLECPPQDDRVTWGLEKIEARRVWEEFGINGTDIVVGSIDTGVRATHVALQPQIADFTHSWFDPVAASEFPWDSDEENGHGTHTIGTMVGLFNIGVAPGANFIACMGCEGGKACREEWLLACGEFMLCPTRPDGSDPDCSRAPRVINFSIGYKGGVINETLLEMTDYWEAAKIIGVYSIGNSGPDCNTTGSPGNYRDTIGVGASDSNDMLAWFSGRGPAPDDLYRIKPDITCPGVEICSASYEGDDKYHRMNGTSMATPHISGIVALILSINPEAQPTLDDVKSILYSPSSVQKLGLSTTDGTWTCNENITGLFGEEHNYKDNYFGYGISIAYEAVKTAFLWFATHPFA